MTSRRNFIALEHRALRAALEAQALRATIDAMTDAELAEARDAVDPRDAQAFDCIFDAVLGDADPDGSLWRLVDDAITMGQPLGPLLGRGPVTSWPEWDAWDDHTRRMAPRMINGRTYHA
jgi:hypothetical protein